MMAAGFGEVAEKLRRSTVQVSHGRGSQGSGVVWSSSGVIVTNSHVAGEGRLTVTLWDGRSLPARLDKRDRWRDLARLRIEPRDLHPATAGDSTRVRVGEVVVAVGNPLGFVGALSTGVVQALGPVAGLGQRDFIQSAVRLAPGNSGGPLADSAGRVIGINTMILSPGSRAPGVALAIPSASVARFLAAAEPPELGVTVQPVRIPDQDGGIGWIVLAIAPRSPAENASLHVGDVLTGVNGGLFRAFDDLDNALDADMVRLRFLRGGKHHHREVAVRLRREVAA